MNLRSLFTLLILLASFDGHTLEVTSIKPHCNARDTLVKIVGTEHTHESFPPSWLAPRAKIKSNQANQLYAAWATQETNTIPWSLSQGRSTEEILERLGASRKKLAEATKHHLSSDFGAIRVPGNVHDQSVIGGLVVPENEKLVNPTRMKMADLAITRFPARGGSRIPTETITVRNTYETLSRRILPGTQLSLEAGTGKILTRSPKDFQSIMADVHKRLYILIHSPSLTEDQKLEQFMHAMYGYYNAMPFARGSSAIGRVFFTGIYRTSFNRIIPVFEDGIDMAAMVSVDYKAFAARIRPLLNASAVNH